MDMMNQNFFSANRRPVYLYVDGVISQIQTMPMGRGGFGGCTQMMTVEDAEGGVTNFFVNGDTYVEGFEMLMEGMQVRAFYNGNLPAALIYPPQFIATAVVPMRGDKMAALAFFDRGLMASDQSLQLNPGPDTEVVTRNNQSFGGSPGGNVLLVLYTMTTRSIPPQTTPEKIVVMCGL